jgi:hypothetical protein
LPTDALPHRHVCDLHWIADRIASSRTLNS